MQALPETTRPPAEAKKYRVSTIEDVRSTRRPPPAWMYINRIRGRCWCGRSKPEWDENMRKYCSKRHADMWFDYISPYWESVRLWVFERDGRRCAVCGREEQVMDVDHKIPQAAGGDFWDMDNLQVLCGSCHRAKNRDDQTTIKYDRRSRGTMPMEWFT